MRNACMAAGGKCSKSDCVRMNFRCRDLGEREREEGRFLCPQRIIFYMSETTHLAMTRRKGEAGQLDEHIVSIMVTSWSSACDGGASVAFSIWSSYGPLMLMNAVVHSRVFHLLRATRITAREKLRAGLSFVLFF